MKPGKNEFNQNLISVLLLLALWQAAAFLLNQNFLLPTPFSVLKTLFTLLSDAEFLNVLSYSMIRIAGGFLLAFFAGCILAVLAGSFKAFEILLRPLMLTIKTVPVASFIILALIWLSSGTLSIFISFLMVLPVIYNNVLEGIKSVDIKLVEMAEVFRFSKKNKILYIWIPEIKSHIISGVTTGLGLCWKSGIAAEVIGIPGGSIGEKLYMSKVYLDTTELFSWTIIIVLLSILFEKLLLYLINLFYKKLESK